MKYKKKIAFIDYWTHKNTGSGNFLRKILSERFEVTDIWWEENKKIDIKKIKTFDYIFFFHVLFPYQILKNLRDKKIIWAPMYDALNFRNSFFKKIFWYQVADLNIKILSFSNQINASMASEKKYINLKKVKYFMRPTNKQINKINKINIFFWDRGRVNINQWIEYFYPEDINMIYYFSSKDLSVSNKGEKSIRKLKKNYNIICVGDKFLPQKKYLNLLKKCNVFVAPRKQEGIGMSIVEAIANGMFIVSYNDSTMNEYIESKKIGFLFNSQTNIKIKKDYIIHNHNYRFKFAQKGYNKWSIDRKEIFSLFHKKKKLKSNYIHKILFIIDDIKFLFKKIFKINFFYHK